MNIIYFLVIGLIAGWLAGQILKGKGFGLVGNLIVGCIGALLGGWLFGVLGLTVGGLIGSLVAGLVGAFVLLWIINLGKIRPKNNKRVATTQDPAHKSPSTNVEKMQDKKDFPNIFICYRRTDSSDVVGRIYDRLIVTFQKEHVFKNVDSVPLGVDFRNYIDERVRNCDVLIAIIGTKWLLTLSDEEEYDSTNDFVLLEIEAALKWRIPIVPVLVQGAIMPTSEELPTKMAGLSFMNGIQVRADPDFHRDMDRLIKGLRSQL